MKEIQKHKVNLSNKNISTLVPKTLYLIVDRSKLLSRILY